MIVLTPAGHSCPIPCSCNACPVICPLVTSSTCPWRAGAGGKRHRTTTCGRDSFGGISRSPQALAYGQVSAHCRHFLGWPSSGSATIYLIAKSEQMGFLCTPLIVLLGAKSWKAEYERLISRIPMVKTDELREHAHQVLHVSFSHNGKLFATCSKDGFVIVSKCIMRTGGRQETKVQSRVQYPYLDITHFPCWVLNILCITLCMVPRIVLLLFCSGCYFYNSSAGGKITSRRATVGL